MPNPKTKRAHVTTQIRLGEELGAAFVARVSTARKLRVSKRTHNSRSQPFVDAYGLPTEADAERPPVVQALDQRVKVAEVALTKFKSKGSFYNPAHAISQAIRDSLDPEKVAAEAPRPVMIISGAGVAIGVKLPIEAVVVANEYTICVRLRGGAETAIPVRAITETGDRYLRVMRWYLNRHRWLWRVIGGASYPKLKREVLTREEARERLLATRLQKGTLK